MSTNMTQATTTTTDQKTHQHQRQQRQAAKTAILNSMNDENNALPLNAKINTSKPFWWRRLKCDDPITLNSIARLPHPPFNLPPDGPLRGVAADDEDGEEPKIECWFDPVVLSSYLVSTCTFTHPISRRHVTLHECSLLDKHLTHHNLPRAHVSHVFTHREDTIQAQNIQRLRDDARDVLGALFAGNSASVADFARRRRTQRQREEEQQNRRSVEEQQLQQMRLEEQQQQQRQVPTASQFPSLGTSAVNHPQQQPQTQHQPTWIRNTNTANNTNSWPTLSSAQPAPTRTQSQASASQSRWVAAACSSSGSSIHKKQQIPAHLNSRAHFVLTGSAPLKRR